MASFSKLGDKWLELDQSMVGFSSGNRSIYNAFKHSVSKAQKTQHECVAFLRNCGFMVIRHVAVTRLFEKGLNPLSSEWLWTQDAVIASGVHPFEVGGIC